MAKLLTKEFIPMATKSCHASTLARVNGDILAAWFGGTAEGQDDVNIYMSRRHEGIWSEPVCIAGEDGLPHWNPVLYARGDLVNLYYKVGKTIPRWHTRVRYSEDGGVTFTHSKELVEGDEGGRGPVKDKPILLRSGALLAGASIETETTWDAFADRSEDGGRTFTAGAFVPLDRDSIQGKGVIQPTLWEDASGVHMLLRSTEGVIMRSDSTDDGRTWCRAYSIGLPNNNSGIDLTQDAQGRLWLCMNPVSGNWAARTPLSLLLSTDGGHTFERVLDLENTPGEYSYPAIIEDKGTLHITYTWNREKIVYCTIGI